MEKDDLGSRLSVSDSMEENTVAFNSKTIRIKNSDSENDHVIISKIQPRSSEELEKIGAVKIADKNQPGIILLGRGNSFSLGRSEVILLHSRPVRTKRGNSNQGPVENHLDSIQEQGKTPSSPPPISEGVSSKMILPTNEWNGMDSNTPQEEVESVSDNGDPDTFAKSLHQLWCKAEKVMTASENRVLKILEEFGIGELEGGGGGDGGGGLQEEEQVWQIVQENYRSQR